MTFYPTLGNYYDNLKDRVSWNLRYGSPVTVLEDLCNSFLDLERGTELPYYFPILERNVKKGLQKGFEHLANSIFVHESPLNKHRLNSWTYFRRFHYLETHFYLYSNETINNLYYYTKMTVSDYQRVNSHYQKLLFSHLAYNLVSGSLIFALVNGFFRSRKATLSTALIASVPTFAFLYFNYQLSDSVKNYFLNQNVRRLGYGQFIAGKAFSFPRNVELTD